MRENTATIVRREDYAPPAYWIRQVDGLRKKPSTSELLDWIKAQGWFDLYEHGNVLLDEVQFGWEISASPGGLDFAVNDFAVDVR